MTEEFRDPRELAPTLCEALATRGLTFRHARDSDSAGVIELIARCFADYDNCILDVDREEPELRAPNSAFWRFWVVIEPGPGAKGERVIGSVAAAPHLDREQPTLELKKLYVHPDRRGCRLGRRLIEWVECVAAALGAELVDLWSDTRFATAHGVYEHLGYQRGPTTRELHDLSATVEFYYSKRL